MFIPVDTKLLDSDESRELSERLSTKDAWRFAVRMWGWGLHNEKETGLITMDRQLLSDICHYKGDADILEAFIETGFLRRRKSGKFYMAGWSRMRRFFKKRKQARDRQREFRKRKQELEDEAVTRYDARDVPPDRTRTRSRSRIHKDDDQGPGILLNGEQVETRIKEAGIQVRGRDIAVLMDLLPIQETELDWAISETRARAAKQCAGYTLAILKSKKERDDTFNREVDDLSRKLDDEEPRF